MQSTDLVLVLSVLILACALPVALIGWALLASNRRLAEHNRDLLKGLLSVATPGAPAQLALNMEMGDRAEAAANAAATRANSQRIPREVGR